MTRAPDVEYRIRHTRNLARRPTLSDRGQAVAAGYHRTDEERFAIVAFADAHGGGVACRRFGITKSTLSGWRKLRDTGKRPSGAMKPAKVAAQAAVATEAATATSQLLNLVQVGKSSLGALVHAPKTVGTVQIVWLCGNACAREFVTLEQASIDTITCDLCRQRVLWHQKRDAAKVYKGPVELAEQFRAERARRDGAGTGRGVPWSRRAMVYVVVLAREVGSYQAAESCGLSRNLVNKWRQTLGERDNPTWEPPTDLEEPRAPRMRASARNNAQVRAPRARKVAAPKRATAREAPKPARQIAQPVREKPSRPDTEVRAGESGSAGASAPPVRVPPPPAIVPKAEKPLFPVPDCVWCGSPGGMAPDVELALRVHDRSCRKNPTAHKHRRDLEAMSARLQRRRRAS